jgi:DNA-binding transcriptional ArsR family regulator
MTFATKLSKTKITEMVRRYDGGNGESTSELAAAFDVKPSSVRYHLKAAGVFKSGTAEKAGAVDLSAVLADPSLQKLIDSAVAARLAQMGGAPVPDSRHDEMKAFTASLAHLIEVQSMQQAGYIKPLPAEEVDRRASALVEMKAVLKDCEVRGDAPEWIVGENGFFECTNAAEFAPGTTIRTYLFPVEDFVPVNDAAKRVQKLMITWIGGHTPGIGEQVEAAMRAANQSAPLVTGDLVPMSSRPKTVEVVDTKPKATGPRRRMAGSIVPERHDVSLAERAAGPQGPVFVGDRAVA